MDEPNFTLEEWNAEHDARADGLTLKPKRRISHKMISRLGGQARKAALTPERRSEIARNAGLARAAGMSPERRSEIARIAGCGNRKVNNPVEP